MEEKLRKLAELLPEVEQVAVDYYGSGDSFDGFNNIWTSPEVAMTSEIRHLVEEIAWDGIERSDANFNDDGCEGEVTIKLRPNFSIDVEVNHHVTETEPGDGYFWESEEGPVDLDVEKFNSL